MKKIYISTGMGNMGTARSLATTLESLGWAVPCKWWTWSETKGLWRIAVEEITAVQEADAVVVLFPGGRGTHIEIGAALAHETPVLLVGDWPVPTSPFYHHPKVSSCNSTDAVAALLPTLLRKA